MSHRRLLLIVLALAVTLSHGVWSAQTIPTARGARPLNVVLLIADDVRWDSLGVAGNGIVRTPRLDRLAADGVRFTEARVTTSICMVSRATLLTGQYMSRHGIDAFGRQIPRDAFAHTFPAVLRRAGYWTGYVGKYGVGRPRDDDFDFLRAYEGTHWMTGATGERVHVTEKNARDSIDFLRTRPKDKPFSLAVGFFAAHAQDNAPEQYFPQDWSAPLYEGVKIPPPVRGDPKYLAALPPFLSNESNEGRVRYHKRFDTPESYQAYMSRYYRLITELDAAVGRVVDELQAQGVLEETLIVFVGDNGYFQADRGLADKWYPYDESVRVPLIVRDPRLPVGRRGVTRSVFALNLDVAPTLVAAAALPVPMVMQGQDLSPVYLEARAPKWRDEFFYEHPTVLGSNRIPSSRAVIRKEWKYVEWPEFDHRQLFDLKRDPGELQNLAGGRAQATREKEMREALLALATGAAATPGDSRPTAQRPQASSATARRPNILWISNEDMSPRLGVYGDATARTPVLDRLARESVRYTNAFSTAPVCAPSRAAIITGMHQAAIGAQHMRTTEDRVPELPGPYLAVPPFYVKAFPEYLRAAGYYTSNQAKTDYQFGVPFTIWDDVGRTAHWRNRADKSQPFFSVFNIEVTHESQIFPSSPARTGKPLVTDPAKLNVPPYYPDTLLVRQELARMYDNIADMDARVGVILKELEEDGLADNTIVFYWSDHGDGVPRAKRSLYDSGLRVPLMIRWPTSSGSTATPGSVRDDLVSFVDLAPTVLALAGVEIPAHLQGRALVGPRAADAPAFVFAARDRMDIEYDMMRSARDARFLYIRNFSPELPYAGHIIYRNQSAIMQEWFRLQAERRLTGPAALWMRTSRPAEELYDTQADPHQIRDLSSEPAHRATLVRMRHAVTEWMARTGDQGLINEAEMIQRMWPGGVQPETAQPYIVSRRETQTPARAASIKIDGPTEMVIYVPTQGASVGYTTEDGPAAKWRLYTGPILVEAPMTLRAKAIRYGYKESAETRVTFTK